MAYTRRHYRIPYPIGARPSGKWAGKPFEVVDLSEEGMKIEFLAPQQLLKGQIIKTDLRFHDSEVFPFQGKVLRQETPTLVVLQLVEAIPLRKIMSEQRYLINHFNAKKTDKEGK